MKGILNQEIKEEKEAVGLLTLAKENMMRTFERRYEEKDAKRNIELKKEFADNYKAKIDELNAKIEQQEVIIKEQEKQLENYKENSTIKDETINKNMFFILN